MEGDVSFTSELILSKKKKKEVSAKTLAASASPGIPSEKNTCKVVSNNAGSRQEAENRKKRLPGPGIDQRCVLSVTLPWQRAPNTSICLAPINQSIPPPFPMAR